MSQSSPREALHLPEGINYTCHQSGLCCPVFPRIPVEETSAARMRELDFSRFEQVGCEVHSLEDAVQTEEGPDGQLVLKRRCSDGNCVFYGEDKLCAVHKTHGEAAKPQVCRDFPYRYRDTPGGVYVGLSFVCPSVRGNRGQPVVEQHEELEQASVRANRHEKVSGPFLLNGKLELSWEDYMSLEQAMLEIMAVETTPLAQRLIALRVLVDFVDLMHRASSGEYQPMAPPRRAPAGEIPAVIKTMRRSGYAEVLRAARRGSGSALLHRMFLGMVVGLGNSMWQTKGRFALVGGLLTQYLRHAAAVGRVEMKPVSRRVSHRQIARTGFPASGGAVHLLARYFGHCIFRKDLLMAPTILRGVNLLLINAALVRWYAAAVAADQGRRGPEGDDFSEAVRHVETYYGMQSKLHQTLATQMALEEVIESFTSRKNYPFIMMTGAHADM